MSSRSYFWRIAPAFLLIPLVASAQTVIKLPAPRMEGGMPLMQALKERQTIRSFSNKPLPKEVLSNLLWAAFGINRPAENKRTAPSAYDHQEIDLYVFTSEGIFIYDAKPNTLKGIMAGDMRAATGDAEFVRQAPVSLVFVADYARMTKPEASKKLFYAAIDTGFIGQNIYLFCASQSLGTVLHDSTDKPALAAKLGLRADQQIIIAQAVGYPERR